MAGNRKFHNKFHSANHHTLPSPHIKDSGLDPVASHEFPFIGDFVLNGVVSASNNYLLNGRNISENLDTVPHGAAVPPGWNVFRDSTYIDGDCTITGNLSALGELTYLHTQVHSTSAQEIEIRADNTNGITAALTVDQYGTNDIVHFKNDGSSTLLITGSANNAEALGGWIGINLGNLPDVDRPNQRMTIVGSVSVVPDPMEVADQDGQADPGTSGSLYIEGGLHVNNKTHLDQVTVDTTDGKFLVSGGSTGSDGHVFDVDIPTHLDRVTIVTDDGDFEVSGSNKMFIDTADEEGVGLEVDTHAKFDQVTIDTDDGPFRIEGGGQISIATGQGLDIDSITTLDKVIIDTQDGPFEVKSSENVVFGTETPMDVDVPILLDRVTVDTDDGEFLVTTSNKANLMRVEVPTHVNNQFVVDTTTENSTISGSGKIVITSKNSDGVGLDVQGTTAELDQTTIDTNHGEFLVHTTGTSNPVKIQVPAELSALTVDTTDGPVRILGSDPFINERFGATFDVPTVFNGNVSFNTNTSNISFSGTQGAVRFNVPTVSFESHTQLDRVTINTTPADSNNRKDFTVIGTGIVDINSDINTRDATLLAGDTDILLQGGEKVKITGAGTTQISVPTTITGAVNISSSVNIDVTNGNTNIFDSQLSWEDKNEFVVGVPTLMQAMSASTQNAPVRIHGYENDFIVDATTRFNNTAIFNGYTESSNTFVATGQTQLSQTTINTTYGQFQVLGDNGVIVGPDTVFEGDVHVQGDITVDGNAYLSAGSSGSINVGDSDIDNVVFKAEVESDITPNTSEAYELGNSTKRWFGVNSVSAVHDNTISTNVTTNDLTVADGIVDISVSDNNKATFRGPGSVHVHTPLTSHNTLSATVGPFVFGGVEETIDNPREMIGPDGITVINSGIDIIPFRVECRSVFQKALTALGPVQIGDLPEGTIEGLPDPTLEILGNAVVKDGNLKVQSDIRHLDNESTMIRFDKDRIELRTLSTPTLCVTEKDSKPITIIGSHDYDTALEIRSDHIGVFSENQISDLFDNSMDIHGNVRVTETLSARTLVVDYLTVLNQSTGNIGGGSGSSSSNLFKSLSGTHQEGNVTPWIADSNVYDYNGTDIGIEFDASELHNIDVQKLYSFTFEVDNPLATALNVGDSQSSTYQLAVRWDDVSNKAEYTLDEISTTLTPNTPKLANIVVKVLKSKTAPFTDRVVKLVVEQAQPVDLLFFAHNILVQDRPERIDAVSIADLDIMGDLIVHNDQSYNNTVTFNGSTKFSTISSDIVPEESSLKIGTTTNKWSEIHADDIHSEKLTTDEIATDKLDVDGNVHITGDLRVDGNAYLSAGAGGKINVGDASDDVVLFNADVDSDILPSVHQKHDLGSSTSKWNTLHVKTISADQIQWAGGTSIEANDVYTNVSQTSADRDSVYALVNELSGNWESGYNSTFLNSNWNDAFTNVSEISSIRDQVIATTVAYSAQWNDSTASFADSASYWNDTTDAVTASADNWNTTHDQFMVSSVMWNQGQGQTALSAVYWNDTTESMNTSANDWNLTATAMSLSSDLWNDTYTWVYGDSATNNSTYNESTYVNVEGDTMTGDLVIEKDLHVKGDLTVDGNAYLSAGASGTINVGDDSDDVVSFNAMLSGDLVPNVDNKFDIGSSTNNWRNVFTSGDIKWSGGDSTQSNETYSLISTTSGTDGYANLEVDTSGKLVLKGDQVPGQAITRVHVAINTSDVKNLTDPQHDRYAEVYEGHLVIIPGTGVTLAAIENNPSGVYNTIEQRWEGYQKLMTPQGIISTVNGYTGPTVALNSDDIGSEAATNKFVTQEQKDKLESVVSLVDAESGYWDATRERVSVSGPGWDDTETLFRSNSGSWNTTQSLVNSKYASWDEAATIATNFVNNTQAIYQYVDQGRNLWTDTYTIVAASSARWNTPEQGTASVITRVSKHLKTPDGAREFLAMQSNNPNKDSTYDKINHEHAMVLPQGTIVRRAIVRGENVSGVEVTIGLHSNYLETNINSTGYKYFAEQPSEEQTKTFSTNNESQVFDFDSRDQIPAGNTLGVSLSSSAPFGVANITFVLEHPDYTYSSVTRSVYDPAGEIAALQAQVAGLTTQVQELLEDIPDPTFKVDVTSLPTVEEEILAIDNVPTGTIAFAADTVKLLVFNGDGDIPQWIEFDND